MFTITDTLGGKRILSWEHHWARESLAAFTWHVRKRLNIWWRWKFSLNQSWQKEESKSRVSWTEGWINPAFSQAILYPSSIAWTRDPVAIEVSKINKLKLKPISLTIFNYFVDIRTSFVSSRGSTTRRRSSLLLSWPARVNSTAT